MQPFHNENEETSGKKSELFFKEIFATSRVSGTDTLNTSLGCQYVNVNSIGT